MGFLAIGGLFGQEAHIQIKNERGRLSQADIERMVREAEENKAEDEENKKRVDAKTGLENYVYSVRNTLNDPKVEGKLREEDMKKINDTVDEAVRWLDSNQTASKEAFEDKRKQVEGVVGLMMQKMAAGAMPSADTGGCCGGGTDDAEDGSRSNAECSGTGSSGFGSTP